MPAMDDTPLIDDPRFAQPTGLNRPLIYGLISVLGLGVFSLAVYGMSRMMAPPAPPPVLVNEAPGMTTPVQPLEPLIKVSTSFAGVDRRPPIPAAVPATETLPPPPVVEKTPAETPAPPTTPAATKPPAPAPPPVGAPTPATPTTPPARPRTKHWLFAKTDQHGDKAAPAGDKEKEHGQSLITAATWVRPVDPTRVLFRGAVIHGIVLEQVVSDIPGDIRIHIDRPVLDSVGQGRVLIPQNAQAIIRQVGQVKYGDKRLGTELVQIKTPDGTLIQFKGAGADKSGAAGLSGKVDNKYPQLALGILGTAALSIGARAPFGSSDSFQPTLPQEFGRDVAGGVNQAGRDVLRRELQVNPTITVAAKDQVTIEVLENISFLSDPVVVSK